MTASLEFKNLKNKINSIYDELVESNKLNSLFIQLDSQIELIDEMGSFYQNKFIGSKTDLYKKFLTEYNIEKKKLFETIKKDKNESLVEAKKRLKELKKEYSHNLKKVILYNKLKEYMSKYDHSYDIKLKGNINKIVSLLRNKGFDIPILGSSNGRKSQKIKNNMIYENKVEHLSGCKLEQDEKNIKFCETRRKAYCIAQTQLIPLLKERLQSGRYKLNKNFVLDGRNYLECSIDYIKVLCPMIHHNQECKRYIQCNKSSIIKNLTNSELIQLKEECYQALIKVIIKKFGNKKIVYCGNKDCMMSYLGIIHVAFLTAKEVKCLECDWSKCIDCKISPYHYNKACGGIIDEKMLDDPNILYIRELSKACPQCNERIEKEDGCDRILCRCGCNFCWRCMQILDDNDPYQHKCPNSLEGEPDPVYYP